MTDQEQEKNKSKMRLYVSLIMGSSLTLIGVLLFYMYFNALMNWDISSGEMPFGYMIAAVICLSAGMMICMIPNQMRMAKWGIKRSMEVYQEVMDETGMNPAIMPGMMGRARMCVECGRNIPFDANLCPYCGHKYN